MAQSNDFLLDVSRYNVTSSATQSNTSFINNIEYRLSPGDGDYADVVDAIVSGKRILLQYPDVQVADPSYGSPYKVHVEPIAVEVCSITYDQDGNYVSALLESGGSWQTTSTSGTAVTIIIGADGNLADYSNVYITRLAHVRRR